ncbi:phosphopantetheine-binding protein [Pseudohaliea sp.]|uniref:phosphopantetheine-binding protein n=1 Tax=Pseudohaliea sp. TaxID=2740289 RepID=UPI0032EC6054
MLAIADVARIVGDVLSLGDRAAGLNEDSELLGAMPEFDSMAVVSIITAFEDEYGILVDDDEVTAEVFSTIGSLHAFLCEQG